MDDPSGGTSWHFFTGLLQPISRQMISTRGEIGNCGSLFTQFPHLVFGVRQNPDLNGEDELLKTLGCSSFWTKSCLLGDTGSS